MAVLEARRRLVQVRDERLAVQLGGAAGTLAALEGDGLEVLRRFAAELELAEPALPWHTNRTRIAELGGSLDLCASVLAKIGLDLVLLAQTEVGEVREGTDGGSSTMPQKRNPVRSVLARACAELVSGYASVLAALGRPGARARGWGVARGVGRRCRERSRTPAGQRGTSLRRSRASTSTPCAWSRTSS